MSYGIQVRDASNNIILNADDTLLPLIYATTLDEGTSGSIELPWYDPNIHIIAISAPALVGGYGAHQVSTSGTTLTYTATSDFTGPTTIIVVAKHV
jgi:hypothetical protein